MVARCISLEGGASPIGLARLLSLKPPGWGFSFVRLFCGQATTQSPHDLRWTYR